MPENASGVVMVEFTDIQDDEILIYESTAVGQSIAKEVSDIMGESCSSKAAHELHQTK